MLDMADNLVADQLAGKRAFGVADAILRQLLPAAPAAPATTVALNNSSAKVSESQNLTKSLPESLNQQQ
jgi:flagellar protein FlgJ